MNSRIEGPEAITLPAEYAVLGKLREFVRKAALGAGLRGASLDSLLLAVDEAATNIISHSAQGLPDEILCRCGHDGNSASISCELVYRADGPFAPEQAPDRDQILERVRSMKRGGLGVFLTHALVDTIEYGHSGGRNSIRLIVKA